MWAQIISALLGLWLMAAPDLVSGYSQAANTNNRIFGPLIVAFSIVSVWEVTRSARFVNTILGTWLLAACFLLDYQGAALVSNGLTGLLVLGLSFVKGKHNPMRFGGGWISLWNEEKWRQGQPHRLVKQRPGRTAAGDEQIATTTD
ncbi:MAG: hypothetical protein K8L99_09275 [Anaerolineae bacterium]|nr:hypothetical protein [Anaerolineae bacterium]